MAKSRTVLIVAIMNKGGNAMLRKISSEFCEVILFFHFVFNIIMSI